MKKVKILWGRVFFVVFMVTTIIWAVFAQIRIGTLEARIVDARERIDSLHQQRLQLMGESSQALRLAEANSTFFYVIKEGDTVSGVVEVIAELLGDNFTDVIWSHLSDVNDIRAGDTLYFVSRIEGNSRKLHVAYKKGGEK